MNYGIIRVGWENFKKGDDVMELQNNVDWASLIEEIRVAAEANEVELLNGEMGQFVTIYVWVVNQDKSAWHEIITADNYQGGKTRFEGYYFRKIFPKQIRKLLRYLNRQEEDKNDDWLLRPGEYGMFMDYINGGISVCPTVTGDIFICGYGKESDREKLAKYRDQAKDVMERGQIILKNEHDRMLEGHKKVYHQLNKILKPKGIEILIPDNL